jgi:hypothetical protein
MAVTMKNDEPHDVTSQKTAFLKITIDIKPIKASNKLCYC